MKEFKLLELFKLVLAITQLKNIICENFNSETFDINLCDCDITPYCNYHCCCDKKCSDNIIDEWRRNDKCKNYEKNLYGEYYCPKKDKRKLSYLYNIKEGGLSFHDHIFQMMCIKYDRTGDMRERYNIEEIEDREKSNYKTLKNEIKENWEAKTNIFMKNKKNNPYSIDILYNNKSYYIYKPDSYGNCIQEGKLTLYKSMETVCQGQNHVDITNNTNNIIIILKNNENGKTKNTTCKTVVLGNGNIMVNMNININYKNTENLDCEINIIKSSTGTTTKVKVEWNKNDSIDSSGSNSYISGKPLLFKINNTIENITLYGPDKDGKCINNEDSSISNYIINFKENIFVSCKGGDGILYELIKKIYNGQYMVGKYGDSKDKEKKDSGDYFIKINNDTNNQIGNDEIYALEFLFMSDGAKTDPFEFITNAKINHIQSHDTTTNTDYYLRLYVKFVEIPLVQLENSEKSKSSLIDLPDEIIRKD